MSTTLEAIYENGVFRPLRPVALRENQRVTVTIAEETPDEDRRDVAALPPTPEQSEPEVRPWRGVFSPEQPLPSLSISELEVRTADLPPWQPEVAINRRWVSDDED